MLSALYSRKRQNDEGFTLIELLVVVIIIGVLAAIALPIFLNQQKAAVDASVQSDVRNSVSQVIGAQALKLTSVNATVSRAGTTLTLAVAGGASKDATVADSSFNNVPASGSAYTLSGFNAGGGKYVAAGSAFSYDGSTGKFSDGSTASVSTGSTGSTGATSYAAGPTGVQPGWYNQNNKLTWPGANIDYAFTYALSANSVTVTATPENGTGDLNANATLWCKNSDGTFTRQDSPTSFALKASAPVSITQTCDAGATPYSWFSGMGGASQTQDSPAYISDFGGGDVLTRAAVYFDKSAPNWTAAK